MMPSQFSGPAYVLGELDGPAARTGFWAKMAGALGATQLIIGSSCIVFHIIAFFMDQNAAQQLHYMGEGILTGGVVIFAGVMGIASSKKRTNCTIVGFLVLSVLAGLFALFPMVFGVMGAAVMIDQKLMMPICQLVLATVEIIVATWSIGVSSQALCCPNSALAQSASRMMSGMDVTQFVSNSNGHVVIFSAGSSQQSMVYTGHHTTSIPYVLQQGIPTVQLAGHPGYHCAVANNPVHQVLFGPAANQYMPLQQQQVVMGDNSLDSPSAVTASEAMEHSLEDTAGEEKKNLLEMDTSDGAPGPDVARSQTGSNGTGTVEVSATGAYDVIDVDEEIHLLD